MDRLYGHFLRITRMGALEQVREHSAGEGLRGGRDKYIRSGLLLVHLHGTRLLRTDMNDWTLALICSLLIVAVLIIISIGIGILIKTGLMVGLVIVSLLGVGLTLHL